MKEYKSVTKKHNAETERLIANVIAARDVYASLDQHDVDGHREADEAYNEATHRLFIHMKAMWETGYRLALFAE